MPLKLSQGHLEALNRPRRIVMHEDANMPLEAFSLPIETWLAHRFSHVDMPGSQIDAIWWDIGLAEDSWALYDSELLPRLQLPGLDEWRAQGVDWVGELVRATHARGLECFWHNRVCPVDFPQPYAVVPHEHPSRINPIKAEHPDWTVPCWWPQGLWNLAVPAVRERKVAILRELVTRYEFDGLQLDFARHTPCLPAGREWELRHEVTTFVREVRAMLLEVEERTGRSLLLAARVPENERGCRADGFDVRAWAAEGLVDIFTPGGRTIDLDLAWYRSFCDDTPVQICAGFDGHHTTDGYYAPSAAYYRGVYANFLAQGADSTAIFNWSCSSPARYAELGLPPMMGQQGRSEALVEIGSLETLSGKSKIFHVERRGGYPWAGNYFYRNDDRPLPAKLAPDCVSDFELKIHDCPTVGMERPELFLRLILRNAQTPPEASFNQTVLQPGEVDANWRDGQIYGDREQPSSGAHMVYEKWHEDSRYPRVDFPLSPELLLQGINVVSLKGKGDIEKIELHISSDE